MKKILVTTQGKPIVRHGKALCIEDGTLPPAYREVLGFKFDGLSWFETGEKLRGSDLITITISQTLTTGQNVFGAYAGTSAGKKNLSFFVYGAGSTSNSYLRMDETLYRPRFGTGKRTLTFGNSEETTGFATNVATTPSTYETTSEAYIGALPNSTSPKFTGEIDGRISASDRLIWVPCERLEDGVLGYYELNKEVFLTNAGTGTVLSMGYA